MKTTKMLTILILTLGLMACQAKVSEAGPMGTAFTYQGRLIDANSAADGLYDFQFKLYDDPNVAVGNQVGSDVNVPDVDVIDGYFTVELDFGSDVFDGNAVWLEIGVRPGELNDPNVYAVLSPRQEVTAVPYALQTRGLFVDDACNVGIGTTNPQRELHLVGPARIQALAGYTPHLEFYAGDGATLRAYMEPESNWLFHHHYLGGAIRFETSTGEKLRICDDGNVGIGKTQPTAKLHIGGTPGVDGIRFPDGTLQTTAVTGGGLTLPYAGSTSTSGDAFSITNTGSGRGVKGSASGLYGTGVYGTASGSYGVGVGGWASNTGVEINYGGWFRADGIRARAVYGWAPDQGSGDSYGGYFYAAGSSGRGVGGFGSWGVEGEGTAYGGIFSASSASGVGVRGAGQDGYGVWGVAYGGNGRAIYGCAEASSGTNYGVYGETKSSDGYAGYFDAGSSGGISKDMPVGMAAIARHGVAVVGHATGVLSLTSLASYLGTRHISIVGTNAWSDGIGGYFEGRKYAGYFYGADVVAMGGNVGIGTTNPTEELHVVGDIYCTGKLTSGGGNDPPYVLYNRETRESIIKRVAKEVPEDKLDGAVLFWNGEDLRFEVYLPARGEFRDLQGNLLAKESESSSR